jgi:hypothetical protein
LRYAERLKYNTDDQTVEKYMNAKRTNKESPETSFHNYDNDEPLDEDSKLVDYPYKNPQLYQSHEISVHLPEGNAFNDAEENYEIEEDH